MTAASDRLEKSRLAILEDIRRRHDEGGPLRKAFRSAMAAVGLQSQAPQPQPVTGATAPVQAAASHPSATASQATVHRTTPTGSLDAQATASPVAETLAPRPEAAAPPLPDGSNPAARKARRAHELFGGRLQVLGDVGRDYWQHHPARLAIELATPALSAYAQKHPARFLAFSAAAGAGIYLARPWRLISVTGLAVAALRSPQLSGALISALYGPAPEDAARHDVHPQ